MATLRTLIFRELKVQPRSLEEIISLVDGAYSKRAIVEELKYIVARKWVFINGANKFELVRVLDSPINVEKERNQAKGIWNYDVVKKISQKNEPEGEGTPGVFRTPFEKYLPKGWMQGGRGTCVGHADAILMQCNYYARTGDFPTQDEIDQANPDQYISVYGQCTMLYDVWYRTVFSPQWCYHISRIVGNVQYPSGSYCAVAIKANKDVGAVTWDQCLTSKVATCAPETYPNSFEDCKKLAVGHKIDGYVTITTFKSLMEAIEKDPSHCVIMPINMYDGPLRDGNLLPIGGELIGSHALPWVFVDRTLGRVGCWNSWGILYPQITWIDENYFKRAAGPGFLPIDANEVLIAKEYYSIIRVKTNILCTITIGDRVITGTEASASYKRETECTIRAVPQLPMYEPSEFKETFLLQEPEYLRVYTFTKTDTKCWVRKLIDDILKGIKGKK